MPIAMSADNTVEWLGMKNPLGVFINDATVTAEIKTSAEAAVSGSSISLSYVAVSDGDYRGSFPHTLVLTEGAQYFVEVTATRAPDNGFRRWTERAEFRGPT
jgi:hypothetical protein